MIRLALPKGRNLAVALAAFHAAGVDLAGLAANGASPGEADRRLRTAFPAQGVEVLSLKDWDLPLYVERGIADCGVVGSDVLDEVDADLLVPVRLGHGLSRGLCRLSLIGRSPRLPAPGAQVRLATKYPATARRLVAGRPWTAEVLKLWGSVELAPVLDLADLALDVVETGRTLRENHLVEIEQIAEVAPCLVVNRASFQRHRARLNEWIARLEAAEMAA